MMLDPQRAEYEFHHYVVEEPTSIENLNYDQKDLSIFPNPFSKQITIEFKNEKQQDEMEIQIFSSIGLLISSQTIQAVDEKHIVFLNDFESGIYFLKVSGYKPSKLVKY